VFPLASHRRGSVERTVAILTEDDRRDARNCVTVVLTRVIIPLADENIERVENFWLADLMKPIAKVAVVTAGYIISFAIASAVVAIHIWGTNGQSSRLPMEMGVSACGASVWFLPLFFDSEWRPK